MPAAWILSPLVFPQGCVGARPTQLKGKDRGEFSKRRKALPVGQRRVFPGLMARPIISPPDSAFQWGCPRKYAANHSVLLIADEEDTETPSTHEDGRKEDYD